MTMPESVFQSKAWRSLAVGSDPANTVLAVDFDATGRQEARFSDMLPRLGGGLTLMETVPHTAVSNAVELVEQWVQPHEEARTQVRAVLGYCAGAVFAATLAERIAEWQSEPPMLLLFDPEISDPRSLLWQFYKTVGIMSSTLGEQDAAAARERAQQICEANADMDKISQELAVLVREIGGPALARAGLGEARRDELFTVFASFLRYLALASQINPLDQWRSAVAFSSTSPLNGMRAMRTGGIFVDVAREIETDVEHDRLLADEKVADAVRRLLNGEDLDSVAREQA